jgi:hypothetical protein
MTHIINPGFEESGLESHAPLSKGWLE